MGGLIASISKGPELSNPLDPTSEASGKTIYVLDHYESPAAIGRHWEEATQKWADDLGAAIQATTRAEVTTLHRGTVINAL
jgi:hypothetical protein